MFSAAESKKFALAFIAFVLVVLGATAICIVIGDIYQAIKKKRTIKEQSNDDEMICVVSDDEYYAIAQKAIEEQKMIDFKCRMNGIDKAIHILKGD